MTSDDYLYGWSQHRDVVCDNKVVGFIFNCDLNSVFIEESQP